MAGVVMVAKVVVTRTAPTDPDKTERPGLFPGLFICLPSLCMEGRLHYKRLFENKSLIKNKKSFRVSPFFKKTTSSEDFWKKLHQKLFLFQDIIEPDFSNSL
ncbi:hypothetical protein LV564_04270 [Komagataeibacter nataicola]|uniref:hypothetical protein n=1 Tax=Komagataeibacter nataicola TaxID=265960 RepID=UPI001474142B|nr:hypothetical protein [Komagataeibacter nataicola]WEQ56319.1 hypothetical protein LV564_04270 [Komagataeibacter nataicola]WNM07891.1 hypothetical protein RI056_12870 [Komagataeibacter nataicola]